MEHSEQLDKLATALAKAQANVQGAHKTAENPFFNSTYADLNACWDACREPLSKEGLSVVQMPTTSEGEVSVTTMIMHASGQWIKETMSCKPAKNDAQAMGSVTTYLRRYMLMGAAGIAPADDDGNAATKGGDKSAEQMTPVQRKEAGLWGQGAKDRGVEPLQITALKHKMRDMRTAIQNATTQADVSRLTTGEYFDVMLQCSEDLPDWHAEAEDFIQATLTDLPEYAEPDVSDHAVPVPAGDNGPNWRAWHAKVADMIDKADSLEMVNEIADANQEPFVNYTKANKDAATGLKTLIENKRGFFAQAPAA